MWASEVGTVVESHDLPDEILHARKEFRENMAQLEKNRSEVCHLLAISSVFFNSQFHQFKNNPTFYAWNIQQSPNSGVMHPAKNLKSHVADLCSCRSDLL
jgi:hypothetical protein